LTHDPQDSATPSFTLLPKTEQLQLILAGIVSMSANQKRSTHTASETSEDHVEV